MPGMTKFLIIKLIIESEKVFMEDQKARAGYVIVPSEALQIRYCKHNQETIKNQW